MSFYPPAAYEPTAGYEAADTTVIEGHKLQIQAKGEMLNKVSMRRTYRR